MIFFVWSDSKGKGNKNKNKQIGLYQTTKLLLSEGNNHQTEKPTSPQWEEMLAHHVSGKILANHMSDI